MKHKGHLLLAGLVSLHPVGALCQGASTLQVYGRIDVSVNHVRFDSTPRTRSTNGTYVSSDTSFIGFRGSEDLGGGMRAYFKLEHGFNADRGEPSSANTFWSRESLVGIAHSGLGSIQLGYQYSPAQWLTTKVDPFGRSGTGSIVNFFQQSGVTGPRGFTATTANTIGYLTPAGLPFFGRIVVGASEGVLPYSRPVMFSLENVGERHFVGVSYDRIKVSGASAGQPTRLNVTDTALAVGATYRFDLLKVHGYYIRNRVEGTNGMTGRLAAVSVPVGQSEFVLSALHRDRSDAADSDASLIAARWTYFLSRRTLTYVGVGRHVNHGTAAFGLNPARTDFVAGLPATGQGNQGVQVGVRHLF
jgi:predicted porin